MFSKIPKEIREIVIFSRGTDREPPLSAETAALHQEPCWELGALGGLTLPWVHKLTVSMPCPLSSSGTAAFWFFHTWDQSQIFSDPAVDTGHGNAPPEAFSSLFPSTCPLQCNPHPAHTERLRVLGHGTWSQINTLSERDVWIPQVPTTVQNNLLGLTELLFA